MTANVRNQHLHTPWLSHDCSRLTNISKHQPSWTSHLHHDVPWRWPSTTYQPSINQVSTKYQPSINHHRHYYQPPPSIIHWFTTIIHHHSHGFTTHHSTMASSEVGHRTDPPFLGRQSKTWDAHHWPFRSGRTMEVSSSSAMNPTWMMNRWFQ